MYSRVSAVEGIEPLVATSLVHYAFKGDQVSGLYVLSFRRLRSGVKGSTNTGRAPQSRNTSLHAVLLFLNFEFCSN